MDAFELLERAGHVKPVDPAVLERAATELLARCEQNARSQAAAGLAGGSGTVGPWAVRGPNRARQRRRRVWLAAAAGVVAVATGVAVTGSLPDSQQQSPAAVHVNLAAWSVNTNPDGTVTLTMRQEDHAALLQRVLREAGVPAVVRVNEKCGPVFDNSASGRVVGGEDGHLLTIRPSAIPGGAQLLVTLLLAPVRMPPRYSLMWGNSMFFQLHPARQPLTCTRALYPSSPDARPSAARR
jgi:hypothetical protein